MPGDGFIALASIPTPKGVIRLANPKNNEEYAQTLYQALRLADSEGLEKVFAIPATGTGVAAAINDRLGKAAFQG
jgi:L-threonylcarbamoyladenylate synthase